MRDEISTTKIIYHLNEIEKRLPVNEWTVDSISIWPLLRIDLASKLRDYYAALAFDESCKPKNNRNKYLKYLSFAAREIIQISKYCTMYLKYCTMYLNDYSKNADAGSHKDIVFLSNGISYSFINNSWYEKFCDPLIERFRSIGITSLLLSPLHKYFIPRKTESVFIQPNIDILRVKAKILSQFNNSFKVHLPFYNNLADYFINQNIPVKILPLRVIIKRVLYIRTLVKFYRGLLKKITPYIAFQVCYYSLEGMAFNIACREFGIHSIDIQHGVAGSVHFSYGHWLNVPDNGYELLPSIFWTWSDDDALAIMAWNNKVKHLHLPLIGGNLLLNKWLLANDSSVEFYDRQVMEIKNAHHDCIHVLYTLHNMEKFDDLKRKLMTICKTAEKLFFWVRLHPCGLDQRDMIKRIVMENEITNINIDQATDLPIYAFLRNLDVHITGCSSTVIEAELFGVPSVVMSDTAKIYYKDQLTSGWAVHISDIEECISAIQYQNKNKAFLKKRLSHKDNFNEAFDYVVKLIQERKEAVVRQATK